MSAIYRATGQILFLSLVPAIAMGAIIFAVQVIVFQMYLDLPIMRALSRIEEDLGGLANDVGVLALAFLFMRNALHFGIIAFWLYWRGIGLRAAGCCVFMSWLYWCCWDSRPHKFGIPG